MIRAKRVEILEPTAVLALQGVTSALSAKTFQMLDVNNDGVIDASDIMAAYATVGGVTYGQAEELARLIVSEGDSVKTMMDEKFAAGGNATEAEGQDGALNFVEFCSLMDQGMMPFEQFLEYMNDRSERRAAGTLKESVSTEKLDLGMTEEQFEALRSDKGIGEPSVKKVPRVMKRSLSRKNTAGIQSVVVQAEVPVSTGSVDRL